MPNYITTVPLNLRSAPRKADNIRAVLPQDFIVEQLTPDQNGWMEVEAVLRRQPVQGYVSSRYLQLTQDVVEVDNAHNQIPPVHLLTSSRIISHRDGEGRAYALNEPGIPVANLSQFASAGRRTRAIHDVINFLDVEHSERYAPNSRSTYCNIYAYDVAYCLGAYLPRVWWTASALGKIENGETVRARYDVTLQEMSANRITDWFEEYSSLYGWQREFDIDALQQKVNDGRIGIIVAQRHNLNTSGHIVTVVPETTGHSATRAAGKVISPLQSQAGSRNRKYFTDLNWWTSQSRFRKFGFYVR